MEKEEGKAKSRSLVKELIKSISVKKLLVWLIFLLVLGMAIFFYLELREMRKEGGVAESEQAQEEVREKIEKVISEVSKLIELPEGEEPVLVEIADREEITENQEFFAKAQNGDVVLIYRLAKKAYLYRPSDKRLINVSSVTINSADNSGEESSLEDSLSEIEVATKSAN